MSDIRNVKNIFQALKISNYTHAHRPTKAEHEKSWPPCSTRHQKRGWLL